MQSEGLDDPLAKIEMPLVRVLAQMEHTRIAVNVEALALQKWESALRLSCQQHLLCLCYAMLRHAVPPCPKLAETSGIVSFSCIGAWAMDCAAACHACHHQKLAVLCCAVL